MKIEKINENQIKFILNKTDLSDRDIKFSELEYGSEKTQELFHEMMEQASLEYGFRSDNTPLMIEAIPITTDSIMIIVTKISNVRDLDSKLNLFSSVERRDQETKTKPKYHEDILYKQPPTRNSIVIYRFKSLDEIVTASKKVVDFFSGLSSVYKYNKQYYLILESRYLQKTNYVLSEYGHKCLSNSKKKFHLMEHGETITTQYAIEKYALM